MEMAKGFIAVDWGTTNRRAYRLERGECVAEFEDDCGVLSLAPADFPAAADAIRQRLGNLPMIMAGMIGSTRGWVEAPYVPCPASLDDLAGRLSWVEPGRTAIVPGLSFAGAGAWDVMRGEEVQLFGAIAAGQIAADCVVAHPGTHNKWIVVRGGRIERFRTVMTGELFSLLKGQGILAEFLVDEAGAGEAFRAGVRRGLDGPALSAELFSVRARVLLGDLARADVSDYTSGLLIGVDLGVGLLFAQAPEFIVMGRPELTRLYAVAAAEAGRSCRIIDGADAFVAGAQALAERIA